MYRPKTLRIRLKCLQHPKYNPEKSGPTFRSICKECSHIWAVHVKMTELRRLLGVSVEEER
jgi:hypothetical protein